MSETVITVPVRDINTITSEIRYIQNDVQQYAAQGALKIGERLCEAKELLGHGEFLPWIKDEFGWTDRTAQKLMAVYREFGDSQKSLFGPEINTKTYSDLPVSKLYLLISVPESEREDFVKENNVAEMSVREMEKLLREKKDAEDESREAHAELDKLADKYAALSAVASEQEKELKAVQADVSASIEAAKKEAAAEAEKARRAAEKAQKAAEAEAKKARDEAEAAKKDLQQLRDNPEIPKEVMDKLKAQFGKAAEEAEARAREAEAKLKVSDPDVAMFKLHFDNLQKTAASMAQLVTKMKRSGNADMADKLSRAACAVLERAKEELA
nr:MAG TPA: Protein of unknown function (DUF3102) [Caudoviricetes sp.]